MRNHQVPEQLRADTTRTLRATAGLVGHPSDAERSRTLLAANSTGALATKSVECPGFPFGSLVAYAVDDVGCPLLALSALAEHSRNVATDRRGSLMVTTAAVDSDDPLALARVTLIGELVMLTDEERAVAIDRYRSAHPKAYYVAFGDFGLYRLEVTSLRYVGGFGRMSWVAVDEYAAAEPDTLLANAPRILEHMNADHPDALVTYCQAFGGLAAIDHAELVGVDRYGMDILAGSAGSEGRRAVRIPFAVPADTSEAVRRETVALLQSGRARLAEAIS